MYEYTDRVIAFLNHRFIEMFGRLNSISSFDELNVLQTVKSLYAELELLVYEMLLKLATEIYGYYVEDDMQSISEDWLLDILNGYDPVTKYVYTHEVERKCSRLYESLMSSNTKDKEIAVALRYFSAMVTQYALTVTDKAVLQAYKDNGIRRVKWISVKDERRCKICRARHGKVYDIDKLPPKPHSGCRCEYESVR